MSIAYSEQGALLFSYVLNSTAHMWNTVVHEAIINKKILLIFAVLAAAGLGIKRYMHQDVSKSVSVDSSSSVGFGAGDKILLEIIKEKEEERSILSLPITEKERKQMLFVALQQKYPNSACMRITGNVHGYDLTNNLSQYWSLSNDMIKDAAYDTQHMCFDRGIEGLYKQYRQLRLSLEQREMFLQATEVLFAECYLECAAKKTYAEKQRNDQLISELTQVQRCLVHEFSVYSQNKNSKNSLIHQFAIDSN